MAVSKSRKKKKSIEQQAKEFYDKYKYLSPKFDVKMEDLRKKRFEGIVPRYQEPRGGIMMPEEPSPKAKELLKKGKPVYFT